MEPLSAFSWGPCLQGVCPAEYRCKVCTIYLRNLQKGFWNLTIGVYAAESDNISPSDYAAENGDRYKRRRMLHFTGAKEEDMAEESPHFEPTPLLDSTFAVNILSSPFNMCRHC